MNELQQEIMEQLTEVTDWVNSRKGFKMDKLKKILKQVFGVELDTDNETIHFHNNIITGLICSPHNGSDHKWIVRFSTVAAFDRWANSLAIQECFDTEEDVVKYLKENEVSIYKQLLEYISEEYDDLEKCANT